MPRTRNDIDPAARTLEYDQTMRAAQESEDIVGTRLDLETKMRQMQEYHQQAMQDIADLKAEVARLEALLP